MLYSFESPGGLLERFPAEGIFQKEWTLRKGNMGWRKPVRKGGSPETAEGIRTVGKNCTSCGGVAQLGEHLPCKQGVRSSILLISTTQWMEKGEGSTLNSCSGKEKWAYSSAG